MEGNNYDNGSPKTGQESSKNGLDRRAVLKAGAGGLASALLAGTKLTLKDFLHRSHPEPKPQQATAVPTQTVEPPPVLPTQTKEPELPQTEWKEPVDTMTANYLYSVYKDQMGDSFTTEDEKKQFMNRLTLLANRVNPENNNLANQLAGIIAYSTEGSFNPAYQNPDTGFAGIFQLSPEQLTELGETTESILGKSAEQQLELLGTFLISVQEKVSPDGSFRFEDLSDLLLAKIKPDMINSTSDTVLFSHEQAEYALYKEFDSDNDGVITVCDIGVTVLEGAITSGQQEEFLNFGLHDPEPTEFPEEEDTSSETEANESMAQHLVDIYKNKMTSNSFLGATDDETNQKKLEFMRELTRVAARLNPKNGNLANQIAAVINFETIGSFSAWIQSPGTKATGLIQFMGDTAKDYGTRLYKLRKMSSIAQLKYVEKYLTDKQNELIQNTGKPFWSISDVYMSVFNPAHMGGKDTDIISRKGEATYDQNPGLQNDTGVITVGDATAEVIAAATGEDVKENLKYLNAPANAPQ